MDFSSPQYPSIANHSICSDQSKLHQLSASIMTSNNIEQVDLFVNFLKDYVTLQQILSNLCTSKEIYFVTSQLILRMLKKSNFHDLRLKVTQNYLIMSLRLGINVQQVYIQPRHYKTATIKFYTLIQNRYIEVICSNMKSLQKHEYNQALEIITHTLSQLLNICSQQEKPHINFITQLFPSYIESKQFNSPLMLQFVTHYQPFNCLNENDAIFPQNVDLYQVLLHVMTQVIQMKQNWEEQKYSESEFNTNRRKFRNRFVQDWVQFAVKQAKLFFNLYVRNEKLMVEHRILTDVVKLLHQVLLFSYESGKNTHDVDARPKYVKTPQYSFPEGILKQLGEDHTFLEVLHQVHTKVILMNHGKSLQHQDDTLGQDKVIEVCEKIMGIYGRMFFVTADSEKYKLNETLLMQNITSTDEIPTYLGLLYTKVSILSQILQSRVLYLCHPAPSTTKRRQINTNQRYNLQYAIVQITSQFIIYSRCIEQPSTLNPHSKSDQIKYQIRQKMQQFLVNVVRFANQHCLQSQCWKIMYGEGQDIEKQDIFTDLRHPELFFPQKVFQMLYQCHQTIEFKFYNPMTQSDKIRFFYESYLEITDNFLGRFQAEFTQKISKFIKEDFHLEYSMMKEFFKAMPYVKIKENKVLKCPMEYKPHNLNFVQQHYQPLKPAQGEIVFSYFEKFDQIITNICVTIRSKYQTAMNTNTGKSLQFFYYLIAVLLQHYLKNSNFYSRASQPLITAIKLLLKIAFQGTNTQSAPSVFAFYEQIVYILSEKSCNSRQLVQVIFETEEQALTSSLDSLNLNTIQHSMFHELKSKSNRQRSLQMVKKLMKSTCQRLVTTDVKELDAALIVLEKVLKEFYSCTFVQEFGYLKEFIQNYMNLPHSLLAQRKHLNRKMKIIELTVEFMQLRSNDFSKPQVCQLIIQLNTIFIAPFHQQKTILNLLSYFSSIQQLIKTNHNNKIFIVDVFLHTIQDFIHDINKDYRKHITSNVDFYETTKSLLHTILQVVQLFGGGKWGSKYSAEQQREENRSRSDKLFPSEGNESSEQQDESGGLNESVQWELNERDNELPLCVQECFYVWVKELGRQGFQVQNYSTWTKAQQQANDKQLIQIYSQYMHLTPNGKLPPLPKALSQKQRNIHLSRHLQRQTLQSQQQMPPLEDVNTRQTRTTKQMIKLYMGHVYRLNDTSLLALYPSIDYKLDYIMKWWDQVMIRGLKPEINLLYVYKKFILFGRNALTYEPNYQLADMLFKIANYYKNDHQYVTKILQQPYFLRETIQETGSNMMMNSGIEKLAQLVSNSRKPSYEDKNNYTKRIVESWRSAHH